MASFERVYANVDASRTDPNVRVRVCARARMCVSTRSVRVARPRHWWWWWWWWLQPEYKLVVRRFAGVSVSACISDASTARRLETEVSANPRGRDSSSSNFSTAARLLLCFSISFFHLNSISSRGKNGKWWKKGGKIGALCSTNDRYSDRIVDSKGEVIASRGFCPRIEVKQLFPELPLLGG